jgi:ubiquinone/menaquinone biosynthesis C-methylase UbiE
MCFNKRKKTSGHKSFAGKGLFPCRWAFTLLIPLRNMILSPTKLLKRLGLRCSDTVLELGSGPGYFSPTIAKFLSKGRLVLADIQQEMLVKAKKRLQKRAVSNVDFHLCEANRLDFQSETFDVIFLVTVLGEIENQSIYIQEFYRITKPNGVVSISECWGDPDRMTQDEIVQLFESQGFKLDRTFSSFGAITLNFRKSAS